MNIKKIGHCCLLIKTDATGPEGQPLTVLTDPGMFSTAQNELTGIDIVLITHEHADHLHIESLDQVLKNNPQAIVITNSAVSKILNEKGVASGHEILEGTASMMTGGLHIQACDGKHEEIFEEIGQVQNTGYLIGGRLFYPGDSFAVPNFLSEAGQNGLNQSGEKVPVEILALPVAGPWCKVSDAIRYALAVAPKYVIPVHDGQLVGERIGGSHKIPEMVLGQHGIEFVGLKDGEERGF